MVAVALLIAAVKKAVILAVAVAAMVPAVGIVVWNFTYRKKGVFGFFRKFPDSELRNAVDGQHVKVTGVISHSLTLVFFGFLFKRSQLTNTPIFSNYLLISL